MSSCFFVRAFGIALGVGALAIHPALAQNQVANYSYGQPGTASYEHFNFWTNNGRRANAAYAAGKNREDSQLRYLGPSKLAGQRSFKVHFRNGRTLYLAPSGTTLRVATAPGAAPKTFTWEYEGPVNGVGTACGVCAEDAQAAMRLVRTHYLK